ncbi:MAG: hypothetical protein COB01_10700 [Lutibacter sp.]|nr:MAG: hypothetical protein COB01_10700 [Lutibacter sp.]
MNRGFINPLFTLIMKELLTFFYLNKYLNRKISELSTGYIVRVKLLASMLHNPDFYIFDEPFSGLDKNFVYQLMNKIIKLSNERKYFLITIHFSQITSYNFPNCDYYKILNGTIRKDNLLI